MRIDNLNNSVPSAALEKTDAVRPEAANDLSTASSGGAADSASISGLAAALHSAVDPNATGASEARLQALRLQIERGEYQPSSADVASRIIDEHISA